VTVDGFQDLAPVAGTLDPRRQPLKHGERFDPLEPAERAFTPAPRHAFTEIRTDILRQQVRLAEVVRPQDVPPTRCPQPEREAEERILSGAARSDHA
jgi:hypothetical protein